MFYMYALYSVSTGGLLLLILTGVYFVFVLFERFTERK